MADQDTTPTTVDETQPIGSGNDNGKVKRDHKGGSGVGISGAPTSTPSTCPRGGSLLNRLVQQDKTGKFLAGNTLGVNDGIPSNRRLSFTQQMDAALTRYESERTGNKGISAFLDDALLKDPATFMRERARLEPKQVDIDTTHRQFKVVMITDQATMSQDRLPQLDSDTPCPPIDAADAT